MAETSRRGHATRLARARRATTASTSSRCSPVTARSTRPPTVWPAPTPRSRRCPAARPTCSRARSASRTTRSTRPTQLLASLDRRVVHAGVGLGPRRTAAASCSTPGSASTPRSIRRVERYGELKRYASHPLLRRRGVRHVVPPLRPHASRGSTSTLDGGRARSRACTSRSSRRRSRTPTSGRRPLRVAPDAGLDTPLGAHRRSGRCAPLDAARAARRRRCDRASTCADAPDIVQRDDVARAHDRRAPSRSRSRSTATTSATSSSLDVAYEPDALTIVVALSARHSRTERVPARRRGRSVMIASTPARGERARSRRGR